MPIEWPSITRLVHDLCKGSGKHYVDSFQCIGSLKHGSMFQHDGAFNGLMFMIMSALFPMQHTVHWFKCRDDLHPLFHRQPCFRDMSYSPFGRGQIQLLGYVGKSRLRKADALAVIFEAVPDESVAPEKSDKRYNTMASAI